MQRYSLLSEDELLQQLEKGEDAAFTEIYNRYWEKLLAIGFYYTRNKQQAEDIVHDVMMSLWMRKQDVKIHSLEAYLATAIKFAVFKAIAKEKYRRELLAKKVSTSHFLEIEEKLEARFLEEYLRGLTEQLPEKVKLVFTYSRSEGLTIAQIAARMNISSKTVEYYMTRALRFFKEALGKIKLFFV